MLVHEGFENFYVFWIWQFWIADSQCAMGVEFVIGDQIAWNDLF